MIPDHTQRAPFPFPTPHRQVVTSTNRSFYRASSLFLDSFGDAGSTAKVRTKSRAASRGGMTVEKKNLWRTIGVSC